MFRLYVFALVAAATADLKINEDLKCADLKPVEHFNLTEYAGKWYEVARIPEEVATYQCATSEYTLDGANLKMKKNYVDNGKQKTTEITAKLASDAKEAGKLELSFKDVPDKRTKHTTLLVLSTDYKNYAVTYICMGEEKDKEQAHFAMVMSRTKKLEGEPKTAVANFMKTLNMKITKEVLESALTKDYFTEAACKVQ